MDRIATFSGLSIDFERVKCIRHELIFIIIDYEKRTEYTRNPFTNLIETHIIEDSISKRFTKDAIARDFHTSIKDYWSDYLKDKNL